MKEHNDRRMVVNNFVLRQTRDSRFSHADLSWKQIIKIACNNRHNIKQGYREGVIEISLKGEDLTSFYSGVVKLKKNDILN